MNEIEIVFIRAIQAGLRTIQRAVLWRRVVFILFSNEKIVMFF